MGISNIRLELIGSGYILLFLSGFHILVEFCDRWIKKGEVNYIQIIK